MTRLRGAPFLVAAAAGLAQAASIALPGTGQPAWALQMLSLAVLAVLLRSAATAGRGFLAAWTFAIAWLTGTFWWLFISMHVYGGLAAPLAALAVFALAAFLALYYGAAGALFVRWRPRAWPAQALAFAAAWLLAELLRGSLFTGFPWGAGGYAHVQGPLAALAPWIGVYGIGFAAAALAFVLSLAYAVGGISHARVGGSVLALLVLAAFARPALAPQEEAAPRAPLAVALLQGNIPQDEKFQQGSGVPLALEWYGRELAAAKAQLVVAPETAIPLLPQQLPAAYIESLQGAFASGDRAALVGIPLGSFEAGYTNSVIGLSPGRATAYRFDKHHLVPFGEFIPPLFRWFTELMNIPLGDFNRGALPQPPFEWRGERLAPNICYEDLFGEEIGAGFRDPARAPTVLVNVSNIGWFGDSIAIDQHLHISRMRALEFDRPVIRATNTGATALIDPRGRVTRLLPRLTRGVLTGEVRGRDTVTPYARWVSAFGLWPLWGLGLAVLAAAAWRARGRGRARP